MNATVKFIKDYCDFSGNRAYILMAIARKNENEPLTSSSEVVYREVAASEEEAARKIRKLAGAVESFVPEENYTPTFRLYMSANARDPTSAYFELQRKFSRWTKHIVNGDEHILDKLAELDSEWISELQRPHNRADSYFMWDWDGESGTKWEDEKLSEFSKIKQELHRNTAVIGESITPNGRHIVTEPFNYTETDAIAHEDMGLKTDGMIFLRYLRV